MAKYRVYVLESEYKLYEVDLHGKTEEECREEFLDIPDDELENFLVWCDRDHSIDSIEPQRKKVDHE